MTMRTVLASVCVLAVLSTLASSLTLKHKTGKINELKFQLSLQKSESITIMIKIVSLSFCSLQGVVVESQS